MNAIRKFQSVAGDGNPVYITDMTYPTELSNILGSALNAFGRTTYILTGFDDDGTGTGNFTPGVVWFNGQVYAFEGPSVTAGQYLFAGTRQADQRVTLGGTTYNAYTEYYLFTGGSNTSSVGTLVDPSPLSTASIAALKDTPIRDGSIGESKYAPGSVSARALAANSVTGAAIAPGSVPSGDLTNLFLQKSNVAVFDVTCPWTGSAWGAVSVGAKIKINTGQIDLSGTPGSPTGSPDAGTAQWNFSFFKSSQFAFVAAFVTDNSAPGNATSMNAPGFTARAGNISGNNIAVTLFNIANPNSNGSGAFTLTATVMVIMQYP